MRAHDVPHRRGNYSCKSTTTTSCAGQRPRVCPVAWTRSRLFPGIADVNVNVIALILLAVTLGLFVRVWVPWGERTSGNLVGCETLSVLGRLRMHGPSVGLVFVASVVLLALGKIGPLTLLMVTALLALLLALPVRYTMTSRGIRAAWTPFRRWTEFGGVSRR